MDGENNGNPLLKLMIWYPYFRKHHISLHNFPIFHHLPGATSKFQEKRRLNLAQWLQGVTDQGEASGWVVVAEVTWHDVGFRWPGQIGLLGYKRSTIKYTEIFFV